MTAHQFPLFAPLSRLRETGRGRGQASVANETLAAAQALTLSPTHSPTAGAGANRRLGGKV